MRDIGIFTASTVPIDRLVEFMRAYSSRRGRPMERRHTESVVGVPPDVVYVSDTTTPSAGYFSEDEKYAIESHLRSPIEGYLSIHFTSTEAAFDLADELAHEFAHAWAGIIDYTGAGGTLGVPPERRRGGPIDAGSATQD